jgi:hypothetical protein
MGGLRRRYGAGPIHLLSLIACFALAGYAVTRVREESGLGLFLVWFVASVVGHDLILWPLYAVADRRAVRLARRHPERLPAVAWINHVRVPIIVSAVLLGISLPLVLRLSAGRYFDYSGVSESPYLGHWLLVTGLLFAGSAVIYAGRVARARRRPDLPKGVEHTFEQGN